MCLPARSGDHVTAKKPSRRARAAVALIAALYVVSYVVLRTVRTEVWARDGNRYVLFPNAAVYYVYRPLELVDGALTGMRFHIGPHRS